MANKKTSKKKPLDEAIEKVEKKVEVKIGDQKKSEKKRHDWFYYHKHDYKTCRECGVRRRHHNDLDVCVGEK